MHRPERPARARMRLALVSVIAGLVLAGTLSFSTASAAEPATMVLEWNQHALAAIYNPPTASPVGAGQTPRWERSISPWSRPRCTTR